jgi:multiple sugar transport system ATP-binding protein
VESLGSEKYLYFDAPEGNRPPADLARGDEDRRAGRLIARLINSGPLRIGEPVMLSFDPKRLHLFDPATGRAIR